jgi:hypothetical protein
VEFFKVSNTFEKRFFFLNEIINVIKKIELDINDV